MPRSGIPKEMEEELLQKLLDKDPLKATSLCITLIDSHKGLDGIQTEKTYLQSQAVSTSEVFA